MKKPDNYLFALQQLVVDLHKVKRNHNIGTSRYKEDDVIHSFSVAMLAWYLIDKHQLKLDQAKVLKYALVHDLAEAYAGDVNAFASEAARQQKIHDEAEALEQIKSTFADFRDLTKPLDAYEAHKDEEAHFVWTVDKLQALVMGDLNQWKPYHQMKIDKLWFNDKYEVLLAESSPLARDVFESLVKYCNQKYYET